ncbi:osmolarity response regulator [Hartmannibacter diazotrophicus]|uniref:Osmolarity response regulator n=1 Tax=Hartmannibacter diazotrophicus TaxID=1482074 RepID=A0A2C9DBN9_9HYPH|nr:response regulator [Hartmannibacter diazotrophicus]SON57653.1 osmolarity response regulator [Hartmannibacter diazotrophicus]
MPLHDIDDATTAPVATQPKEGGDRRVRVLLLDDDDVDARIVRHYLDKIAGFDFDVVHIRSIDEALKAAERDQFDIYITDYWLGKESSVAFIREVGQRDHAPPIIVFSQLDHSDIQEIGFRAGATAFIGKDLLSPDLLGSTIRSVLHDSERRQSLQFRLLENSDREAVTARGVTDWLTALSGRIDRIHTAAVLSKVSLGSNSEDVARFVDDIIAVSADIRQDLYGRVAHLQRAMSANEEAITRVDAAALVADTVRIVKPEAEKRGIRIDYVHPTIPVLVDCDPLSFKSALRLLLVGAIRHGRAIDVLKLRIRIDNGELVICMTEPAEALTVRDEASSARELTLASFVLDDRVSALMLVESMLDHQGGRLTVAQSGSGESAVSLALPIRQAA